MNLIPISNKLSMAVLQVRDENPEDGPEILFIGGKAVSCTCGPWRQQGNCRDLAGVRAVLEKEGMMGILKAVRKSREDES